MALPAGVWLEGEVPAVDDHPARPSARTRPEVVRHDRGGWISGPCIGEPAGPYETSRDAAKASVWSTEGGPDSGLSVKTANLADLESATSGLALGEWDRGVMTWLAGYEPATVSVICGLIRRARQG
jgi:hypothetical protein